MVCFNGYQMVFGAKINYFTYSALFDLVHADIQLFTWNHDDIRPNAAAKVS